MSPPVAEMRAESKKSKNKEIKSEKREKDQGKNKKRKHEDGTSNDGATVQVPAKKNKRNVVDVSDDEYEPAQTEQRSSKKGKQELLTEKPSAVFNPEGGRKWTVSIALPGSIMNTSMRLDQKTLLAGRIARAAAVWCVDEIVVYDDEPTNISPNVHESYRRPGMSKIDILNSIEAVDTPWQNPDHFLVSILEHCECPPHLKRSIYQKEYPEFKSVGMVPPTDMPHHQRTQEWLPYREGIALSIPCKKGSTYINCGLPHPVKIPYAVKHGMRVTVAFADKEPPSSWPNLSARDCELLQVDGARPSAPREDGGYYWGYTVRRAASLSDVFQECDFEGGYDFSIGTSERGDLLTSIIPDAMAPINRPKDKKKMKLPDQFQHMLVVFGGVAGLEPVIAGDPVFREAGLSKNDASKAFDFWVNLAKGQGSRTIRTEEAIEIALTSLKGYTDYQYEQTGGSQQ